MKRRILIVTGLVVLIAILGLPAIAGWQIRARLSEAVARDHPEARLDWSGGWLRSRAVLVHPDFRARMQLGHPSLNPPGWLALEGRVIWREPTATVDFRLRLEPGTELTGSARAPRLELPGPVVWSWLAPQLELHGSNRSGWRLDATAERLGIFDGFGNRLTLMQPQIEVRVAPVENQTTDARLTIQAARLGKPPSRVVLELGSIDTGAVIELAGFLQRLADAGPGSAQAGLEAIGAAGAWQQITQAGLRVRPVEFLLDGDGALAGQWQPGQQSLELRGHAARGSVTEWWSTIHGLAEGIEPDTAATQVEMMLAGLQAEGTISLEDRRVSIEIKD